MKPTQMPEMRRDVLRYLAAPIQRLRWRADASLGVVFGGNYAHGLTGDQLIDSEATRWRNAELFYVTEDMTTLATAAAESLPSFALQRSDLPADFGVIYFASPVSGTDGKHNQMRACTWGIYTLTGTFGVWISIWTDSQWVADHGVGMGTWSRERAPELLRDWPPVVKMNEKFWAFATDDEMRDATFTPITRTIRASWLLMQQQIASVHRLQPRRADLRLARRRKVNLSAVRIVSLRHRKAEHTADGDGRQYEHRWVVRGHWRKQWYPSQKRHIPIWINAHVKGPDGAPMLTGEIVNAWRR